VKRVLTFLILLFALATYCFSIDSDTKNVAHTFQSQDVSFIKKDLSRPSITLNYNGVVSQSENLIEVVSSPSNYDTNTNVQKYSFVQSFKEQIFTNKLKRYSKTTLSSLLQYRKTDAIFPFHYFW
jgi:hypothetical protein